MKGRGLDAVVIGAGINGCCIAWSLARRGMRVALLDKAGVAQGPTAASSGLVRQHYSHPTLAAMARDSLPTWREFPRRMGGDCGFVACGVVVFGGGEEAAALRQTAANMRAAGIAVSELDGRELRRLEPALNAEGIALGVLEHEGGYADPPVAARGIAAAAVRLGVDLRLRTPVTGLMIARGRVAGVRTAQGTLAAPVVVNAAGPWGGRIAAMGGASVPMRSRRRRVGTFRRPAAWRRPTPVWADLAGGWYFKPQGHDTLLCGSLHDQAAEMTAARGGMRHRFPAMAGARALRTWTGVYDVTPDWQPVIDAVPGVTGFFCATGFSGSGFKIAPAVGEIMADLVLEGRCARYDLGLFRYDRWGEAGLAPRPYRHSILG